MEITDLPTMLFLCIFQYLSTRNMDMYVYAYSDKVSAAYCKGTCMCVFGMCVITMRDQQLFHPSRVLWDHLDFGVFLGLLDSQ